MHRMLPELFEHTVALSETTDVGTIVPIEHIKMICNKAIKNLSEDSDWVEFPRHQLGEDAQWWRKVLSELYPDHYLWVHSSVSRALQRELKHFLTMFRGRIVPSENSEGFIVVFTFRNLIKGDQLQAVLSEAQVDALSTFIGNYRSVPGYKSAVWPRELREMYNKSQPDEATRINLPRAFLSLVHDNAYSDICR